MARKKGEMEKFSLRFLLDIPANKLAIVALVIWICSLALPGIDLYFLLYSKQHWLVGYEILATGWLSLIFGNFAWFANIFFLYGFFQLKSGRSPVKSSIFAGLLSLDTFRFDQYVMNEGGSTTPVYGYGWGAVLWFLSIYLLLTAVGTRQLETRVNPERSAEYEWLRPLGIFLMVVTLGTSGFFAIYDRIMANPTETQRLAGIAFKRGKICHAPELVVADPIRNFSGALEVVMDESNMKTINANYPFRQSKDLLSWGIPIVRYGNTDYSILPGKRDGTVISSPASGAPTAILYINETDWRTINAKSINAKLVEVASNRVVFDQTWEEEPLPGRTNPHFCPDYHSFPSLNEQPRRLLMQALGMLSIEEKTNQDNQQSESINAIVGTIIGDTGEGVTRKMRIDKWKEMNPDAISSYSIPFHEEFNTNCPIDIGWDSSYYDSRRDVGWAFMVKGKTYYPRNRKDRNYATCEGDFAYLYFGGNRNDGKYYLNIEKRTLPDFRNTWAGIILIPKITSTMRDNVLEIQSIKEDDGSMTLKLVNEDSGEVLLVQAPIHDKPSR